MIALALLKLLYERAAAVAKASRREGAPPGPMTPQRQQQQQARASLPPGAERAPGLVGRWARKIEDRERLAARERRARSLAELAGIRGQALSALRHMAKGSEAVVTRRRAERGPQASARPRVEAWRQADPLQLRVQYLPGCPLHPEGVGAELLAMGWIEPATREHCTPHMRCYTISMSGKYALRQADAWWSELPRWERAKIVIFE